MAEHVIMAVGVNGDAGVYKLVYDDSANTVVVDTYKSNATIDGNFEAYCIQQSPLDNQWYVAGNHTGGNSRIYKMDSDLTIDSTWASGTGYAEFTATLTAPDGANKPWMDIHLDGTIAFGGDDSASNDINIINSSGTTVWQGKGWDDNPTQDMLYVKRAGFLPNGNLFACGPVTSNDKYVCVLNPSDGSYVNSYLPTQPVGQSALTAFIGKSNKVYIAHGTSTATTLHAATSTNFSSVDYTETGTDIIWANGPFAAFEHTTNGFLYVGTRTGDRVSVHKLSSSTGTEDSSYTFDATPASLPAILGACELPNGDIFYCASGVTSEPSGESTTYGFIVNQSMSYVTGISGAESNLPTSFYSPASIPAPIISSSTPTDLLYTRKLVAFSGDSAYYESAAGTMTEITETGGGIGQAAADTFDMSESLTAAEAYQKVFVANNTTLAVVDFVNTRISSSVTFTNVSLAQHGTLLYQNSTSPATLLVDTVLGTSVVNKTMVAKVIDGTISTATAITTESGGGGDTIVAAGTLSVVNSVPFIYNHTPCAHPTAGTNGTMPEKATLVCRYRGRVVYAGNPDYPYQWYMARQADPFDFLYVVNDAQAPVAGGNADAGEIGDVIQALIPKGDDYLVFGCSNTVWLMRGDPAAGGSLDELTATTGIYGPRSWCFDDFGNLYFWGRNGVYRMPPNFSGIENISATVLPNLVADEAAEKSTHRIVLSYDRVRQTVNIFITKMSDGTNSNYIYDIRTQGFFPESYPSELAVFSAYFYDALDTDYQKLYLGEKDSYIRNFDNDKKDDAGYNGDEAINSYATIGPLQIGEDASSRGRMKTMSITTGTDTDGVTYDIHVADSAEEVVDDSVAGTTPLHTGTISAGNRVQQLRPRARGAWLGIKLENITATEAWQFEKLVADVKPAGDIK